MTPSLEEALREHFIMDSPLFMDVRGLMELATQEERERCAKHAELLAAAHPEASALVERIRYGIPVPDPAEAQTTSPSSCIPCSSCGGMRRENCKDFPNHGHEWCDCQ